MVINEPMERLVVYAPQDNGVSSERLRTIVSATTMAARDIGVQLDGVLKRNTLAVSIYYEKGGKENWVYSDWEKNLSREKIYEIVRDLTFILKHVSRRTSEENESQNV